jgi:hypothetical protein
MSNGKVTSLPQFDGKAVFEECIQGLSVTVSVFYLAGWYMQNIWHEMAPRVQRVCLLVLYLFVPNPPICLFPQSVSQIPDASNGIMEIETRRNSHLPAPLVRPHDTLLDRHH